MPATISSVMPDWVVPPVMVVRSAASVEACPWTTSSPCSVTSLADTVEVSAFGGFGGGGGAQQQRRYRGSDLRVKVKLNLKEISTGVEKKFKLKKYVPCTHCHGTGAEGDGGSETCPTCNGSGTVIRNQQTILGTMQTRTTCPTCGGEGKSSRTSVRSVPVKALYTVKK